MPVPPPPTERSATNAGNGAHGPSQATLACDLTVALPGGPTVEARFHLHGRRLVLFGPTGAGKTVILRTLAGLVRPVRGYVHFRGVRFFDDGAPRGPERAERAPTTFLTPQERRVGYAPQHASLFPHLSVEANVRAGMPASAKTDTDWQELGDGLGLGPLLGRAPATLSGGERQRVALARALARGPGLLLLDEPFAALHVPERRRVHRWLADWAAARDVPVVLVTHDPAEAHEADHLVVVEGGRTVEEGEPAALLAGLASLASPAPLDRRGA